MADSAHIMVIGGGPAGLKAALDLADLGARVTLVEQSPAPGGTFTQLDVQYPTVDCGACQIHDSLSGPPWAERRCLRTGIDHPLVTLRTSTTVTAAEPLDGKGFRIDLEQGNRWIDAKKCVACGTCAELCPVSAPDAHEAGRCERRAAYRHQPLSVPAAYVIDEELCTQCGDCVPACPEGAIELGRPQETDTVDVDAVIVAIGFDSYDPAGQPQWAYGRHPDVVTALELERMVRPDLEGGLTALRRPSDGEPADRVAFVQCVGSRDHERPYCSAICCMHALKEAILLRERLDVSQCDIYAIDVRCTGKGYEQTLERALASGVNIINARPGAVEIEERPLLRVELPGLKQSREPYDLVVLSVGVVPPAGAAELTATLGIDLDEHGFVETPPESLVQTSRPGVFVCGAASGPCDLPWSVTLASQAALLAAAHAGVAGTRRPAPRAAECREPHLPVRSLPVMATRTASAGPKPDEVAVVPRAIVLGAGPAGLTAARAIGRAGLDVTVIERDEVAGGNLRKLERLLLGPDPKELLEELLAEVETNDHIELLLGHELVSHSGGPGRYTAVVRRVGGSEERRLRHGAMIVATGCKEIDPGGRFRFSSGNPGIVTQMQLEADLAADEPRLLAGVERPTVVMIQCVGSREPDRPVCSRVCCHDAVKNALTLTRRVRGARVIILHKDLRTVGYDEQQQARARSRGVVPVRLKRGRAPRVEPTKEQAGAVVHFDDELLGRAMRVDADLVVLSAGLLPNLSPAEAEMLGLQLGPGGFVNEANAKYRPVEANRRGVLVAGAALAPVLVTEATALGEAAAMRAVALLSREQLVGRPGAAAYRAKWCARCGLCIDACPAGARELDPDRGAIIHAGLCQGCGGCVAACPSGCTDQPDLDTKAVLTMLEAALEVVS